MDIILYHKEDVDGYLSCASVIYGLKDNQNKRHFIGGNYESDLPDRIIQTLDSVDEKCNLYIVDHSISPKDFIRIANHRNMNKIFWFDHHVSAIEDYKKAGLIVLNENYKINNIPCYVQNKELKLKSDCEICCVIGISGCYITYYELVDPYIPEIIKLASIFDVWDKESSDWDKAGLLNLGLQSYLDPKHIMFLSNNLNESSFNRKIIQNGKIIKEYVDLKNQKSAHENAFTTIFEGYTFCAANSVSGGSLPIEPAATPDHDGLMSFYYCGEIQKWRISLYHNPKSVQKPDFSIIAKKYGGGGHAGACGFKADEIPFKLPRD